MSRPRGRRSARQDKHARTHDTWGYEEQLFALAGDMLDEMAPAPSNQVPNQPTTDFGSRTPYPAKGRPATTRDRYVYDTGE